MADIVEGLLAEANRLEAQFLLRLAKEEHGAALVDEYRDIAALRQAADIATRRAIKTRGPRAAANNEANEPAPDGFVLIDEVREAVRQIEQPRFRALQVYDVLQEKWHNYITADKRPSIGATLSNLVNSGLLVSERDGQRKVWYRLADGSGDHYESDEQSSTDATDEEDTL